MTVCRTVMLALLVCAAMSTSQQVASAQGRTNHRYAQNTPASPTPMPNNVEELPPGQRGTRSMTVPPGADPFVDDGASPGHFHSEGYYEDVGSYGYGQSCSEPCGGYPGGSPMAGCGLGMWGCGQWFVNADYLSVRAHFSDALTFIERPVTTVGTTPVVIETFNQFDFDYESSYRVGGGYRSMCGEEVRFQFTHLQSFADDSVIAPDPALRAIFLPYTGQLAAGQQAFVSADVDVRTYDLEYRKTISFGGAQGVAGCGDACCDPCAPACPAWDITFSGGVRGADVDLERNFTLRTTTDTISETISLVEFEGAGPRLGVEGRRYFGCGGWFNVFMKGDLSLLYGELDLNTTQRAVINNVENIRGESLHVRQVIPVTELEAGVAANITCNSMVSAGYMLSAWHDLGFREEAFQGTLQFPTHYDDANILSFDGFFARLEVAF